MRFGYLYIGDRTPLERTQRRAVLGADVGADRLWIDRAPSRAERDELADRSARPGDVIVIASPACIGDRWPDVETVLARFAERGVAVAVAGSDPVVYDDDAKMAGFREIKLAASREENGRALGRQSGRAGRRPKWQPDETDRAMIGRMWRDRNIPPAVVLDEASRRAGCPVERYQLVYLFGKRSQ